MRHSVAAIWCVALITLVGNVWAVDDPSVEEPPPDRPLNLQESIRIAFENHGDIGAAQEQLVGAQQRVIVARSSLYPQLDYDSSFQRQRQRRVGTVLVQGVPITVTGTTTTTTRRYNLNASQLLWDMGQTRTQVRQAKAGVLSAEANVGLARTAVAFDVADTYFQQLRQEKLLELAKEQVKQAEQHLEMVQAQVEAGVSARIDLQPVRVELRQAQFNLVSAQNNARIAATNFRNALGLDRGPALKLEDIPESVSASVRSLEEYLAEATRLRPDLQQSQANVLQAEAAYSLAKIQARPLVSITTGYTLGFLDSPVQESFNIFGALSVPLFDAGALRAEVREAKATLEASRIRAAQLAKDVSADVEAAHANLVSAAERIEAARALVEEARANLDAANEKYRLGVGIALEIVDAQIQFFNAQISATEALYDYHVAQANLDRVIGRWAYERPVEQANGETPMKSSPTSHVSKPRGEGTNG